MSDKKQCASCGAILAESGPAGGLCPRCLIRQGLSSRQSTQTGGGHGRFVPPDPKELAGRFPHFEILELIGHGGMGAVYKARQTGLGRLVALKILSPERVTDPAFAERFGREARTLARLSHPHIVGIHDFGEADGLYYLVMEYVDGANLREVMQAARLSPTDALGLVPQLCEALQFAHESGVVHRDIKPENILIDRAGQVKIADFGLAKLLEPDRAEGVSLTVSGAAMGTPAYMAPEQIEHPVDVDHRADIYAVGVVLYEMLTGELPLGRFDPPSSKVRLDVRIDQVVLRALEKEPRRRYQFVGDVKADLESLDRAGGGRASTEPPHAGFVARHRRGAALDRPQGVTWVAVYSFVMAGAWALLFVGAGMFSAAAALGVAPSPLLGHDLARQMGVGPGALVSFRALLMMSALGLGMLLALWHLMAGFGALRLRRWARYHLIVLAVIELVGFVLPLFSGWLIGGIPAAIASIAVLIYLFKPAVAQVFERGAP